MLGYLDFKNELKLAEKFESTEANGALFRLFSKRHMGEKRPGKTKDYANVSNTTLFKIHLMCIPWKPILPAVTVAHSMS